jgi:hypothetical protein
MTSAILPPPWNVRRRGDRQYHNVSPSLGMSLSLPRPFRRAATAFVDMIKTRGRPSEIKLRKSVNALRVLLAIGGAPSLISPRSPDGAASGLHGAPQSCPTKPGGQPLHAISAAGGIIAFSN